MDDFSRLTVDYGGIHDSRFSDTSDVESDDTQPSSAATAVASFESDKPHNVFHGHHHHHHHHKKSPSSSSIMSNSSKSAQDTGNSTKDHGDTSGSRLQDKIFAKLLQQIVPGDYDLEKMEKYAEARRDNRPSLSLTMMSGNFRRFNARVGIVFVFQHQIYRLFEWENPTHTLSFLAIYSFICLNPRLLVIIPVAMVLIFIMVPAFIATHPPPPVASSSKIEPYMAHGSAIAPPPEVRAVSEMSKDFFRNLRDLQNTMADFSEAHDEIIATIGPPTNFSDEKLSSGVYQALFVICIILFLTSQFIPWGPVLLTSGWFIILALHPIAKKYILSTHDTVLREKEKKALSAFTQWVQNDIILDEEPETREVEIFELQKRTSSGEWESWIFSPKPYEPLSPARIAHQRPQGTRFFEDVQPPQGWEFKDKKWTLDLGSNVWVQERYITGVEVEEDNGRWVYDYTMVDGHAQRGDWRRRRWVRSVVRKKRQSTDGA